MFADLHLQKHRKVTVTVVDPEGKGQLVGVPRAMKTQSEQISIMPSRSRVRALAAELATQSWVMVRGQRGGKRVEYPSLTTEQPPGMESQPLAIRGVIVQVWQYDFDADSLQLQRRVLVEESTLQAGSRR